MKKELSLIIFLTLLLTIPFINKAFHIDDTFYLEITRQIVKDPAHPFSFMINWFDVAESGFSDFNPPLYSYLLAPIYLVCGANEMALHLVSITFLLLAALSFYFLFKELKQKPFYPTLIFLSIPFFAAGLNLMIDVPALGLTLFSLFLFFRGINKNARWIVTASGLFLGMALLTKYSAVSVLPSLLIYPFVSKKRWSLLATGVALSIFFSWNIYTYFVYGKIHFMSAEANHVNLLRKYLLNPLTLIMVTGLLFPYAIFFTNRRITLIIGVALGVVTGAAFVFLHGNIPTGIIVAVGIFLGISLFALMTSKLKEGMTVERPIFVFMSTWVLMIVIMNIFFTPFIAARNIIFMYPALTFIIFYKWDQSPVTGRLRSVIVIMALLSLLIGYADYRYANTYREAANKIAATYSGKKVWYVGHWGWQCYAALKGFEQLSIDNDDVKDGDIVVIPRNVHKQVVADNVKSRLFIVESLEYTLEWLPIRTQSEMARAGFFASKIDAPPFAISTTPLEVFDIYRVE